MTYPKSPRFAFAGRLQGWGLRGLLLAGLLLAAFLRLYRLGAPSLSYDESVSLYLAQEPLRELIAHTAGDIHPPAYYILLRGWILLAGTSEFSAAFLSLAFGLLIVALAFRLGRGLGSSQVGALALFLVAVSPFNVAYSQEIRMYTLGAFLGALAFVFFLHMMRPSGRFRALAWAGYVAATILGLYSLYYFGFLLVFYNVAFIWLWWSRGRRWAKLGGWLGAHLAIAALYLPWAPVAMRQALDPPVPPWREFTGLAAALAHSWNALCFGETIEMGRSWPLLVGLALVVASALVETKGRRWISRRGLLLSASLLVPVGLIWLLSLWAPLYHPRYVFTFSPAFYVLLALGLARWARAQWLVAGLMLAAWVGGSALALYDYHFDARYAPDGHRAAVKYVEERWVPGDAVLIDAGYAYPAFLYYFGDEIAWRGRLDDYPSAGPVDSDEGLVVLQTGSIDGDKSLGWGDPQADFYPTTVEKTLAGLQAGFERHPRVWVYRVYDTVVDPDGVVREWLDAHGWKYDELEASGPSNLRVQGYFSEEYAGAPTLGPMKSVDVEMGGQLELVGYELQDAEIGSGEELAVALHWRPLEPLSSGLFASLALYDDEGRSWAQVDRKPLGPLYGPSEWPTGRTVRDPWRLPIPAGTPPGDYSLQVAVYDRATGTPLEVRDAERGMMGIRIGLEEVRLARGAPGRGAPEMESAAGVDFDGLRLLGATLTRTPLTPGESVALELAWQALRPAPGDFQTSFSLEDARGEQRAAWIEPLVDGKHPAPLWDRGEVARDKHELRLPNDLGAGRYELSVGLVDEEGEAMAFWGWLPPGWETRWELGEVTVEGREARFEEPSSLDERLEVRLGDSIELVGYEISEREPKVGEAVYLTLHWKCLSPVPEGYKVFAHVVRPDGEILAQHDGVPRGGEAPTSSWLPGEFVEDVHSIEIPADAAAADYPLLVGMYEPASGVRLPVVDEKGQHRGDSISLGALRVKQ